MKHNWEYKTLGDVCYAKRDIKRAKSTFNKDDKIQYYDISSIDNITHKILSKWLI